MIWLYEPIEASIRKNAELRGETWITELSSQRLREIISMCIEDHYYKLLEQEGGGVEDGI